MIDNMAGWNCQKSLLSLAIPKHVAIIMDGNRKWARKHQLSLWKGYAKGIDALIKAVQVSIKIGIRVLTVFAFSTENWHRSQREVNLLMKLFQRSLLKYKAQLIDMGVQLKSIGDEMELPQEIRNNLLEVKRATEEGQALQLVLALNYGGRDDLRRAVVKIIRDVIDHEICLDSITEELISRYLDTSFLEDPDLLIRFGGEKRMSNFLLWQISYAELYLSEILWPDFSEKDFYLAISEYQKRQKRKGT